MRRLALVGGARGRCGVVDGGVGGVGRPGRAMQRARALRQAAGTRRRYCYAGPGSGRTAGGCGARTTSARPTSPTLTGAKPTSAPDDVYCTDDWSEGHSKSGTYLVRRGFGPLPPPPSRPAPPDSNGWYNHAVAVSFTVSSSFSGIASCTSTTYAGPDTTSATGPRTLRRQRRQVRLTVTSAPFAYDATPPTLTATADPGDQSVALSWQAGGDVAPIASIRVTRSGGAKAAAVEPCTAAAEPDSSTAT